MQKPRRTKKGGDPTAVAAVVDSYINENQKDNYDVVAIADHTIADEVARTVVFDDPIANNNSIADKDKIARRNALAEEIARKNKDFYEESKLADTITDDEIREKVKGYYKNRLNPHFSYLVPENSPYNTKDGYKELLKDVKQLIKVVNSSQKELPLLLEKLNEQKKYYEDSLSEFPGYNQEDSQDQEEESRPSLKKVKLHTKQRVKSESDSESESGTESGSESGSRKTHHKHKQFPICPVCTSSTSKPAIIVAGGFKAPRHTFNLDFVKKLIVDVQNQTNIIEQKGRDRISALKNNYESSVVRIEQRITEMKENEGLPADKIDKFSSEKTKNFVFREIKLFNKIAINIGHKILDENKQFYIHTLYKKQKYIRKFRDLMNISEANYNMWNDNLKKVKDDETWGYEDYKDIIGVIDHELKLCFENILQEINKIITKFITEYNTAANDFRKRARMLDEQMQIILNEDFDQANNRLSKFKGKLISLYSNEDSIMDIILDSHFISLYVLKALHFGIILISLFLTEKIFSEMYMKAVYAENGSPPNLIIMLAIFVVIDFGFILFILTVMFLLMYIFQKPSREFIINGELIKAFLLDYVIFIVLLFIILTIVAMYMQSKKYFRYNTEGLRAIRALKDITLPLAGTLLIMPFFAIM